MQEQERVTGSRVLARATRRNDSYAKEKFADQTRRHSPHAQQGLAVGASLVELGPWLITWQRELIGAILILDDWAPSLYAVCGDKKNRF